MLVTWTWGEGLGLAPFCGRLRVILEQITHVIQMLLELFLGPPLKKGAEDLGHCVALCLQVLDVLLLRRYLLLALHTSYRRVLIQDEFVHALNALHQELEIRFLRVWLCGSGNVIIKFYVWSWRWWRSKLVLVVCYADEIYTHLGAAEERCLPVLVRVPLL
jgi:hypothetical protein